jgi:hypothetical protein
LAVLTPPPPPAALAPSGNLLVDMLSFTLLAGIPPHPRLFRRRPPKADDGSDVPTVASAAGAGAGTGASDDADLAAEWFLGEPTASAFTLSNWRLDAGTLAALTTCLPASTSVTTVRCVS